MGGNYEWNEGVNLERILQQSLALFYPSERTKDIKKIIE